MMYLAQLSMRGIGDWFNSPVHRVVGGIGVLIAAFIIYELAVNLHDIIRTLRIHFM